MRAGSEGRLRCPFEAKAGWWGGLLSLTREVVEEHKVPDSDLTTSEPSLPSTDPSMDDRGMESDSETGSSVKTRYPLLPCAIAALQRVVPVEPSRSQNPGPIPLIRN